MLPYHRHDGFSIRNFTNLLHYHSLGYNIKYVFLSQNTTPEISSENLIIPNLKYSVLNTENNFNEKSAFRLLIYLFGIPSSRFLDSLFNYRTVLDKYVKSKLKTFPNAIFHFEDIDAACCIFGNKGINSVWSNHDYVSERFKKRKILINDGDSFIKKIKIYFHYLRLRKAERLIAKSSKIIITISETEKLKYQARWPKTNINLIPISWHDERIIKKDGFLINGKINLIHIGRVDGFLGYQSLKYIFEKVFPLLPDTYLNKINFNIVGLDNNSVKSTEIKTLAMKYKNVQILGFVDDIKPFYSSSDLHLVASKYATGARTRIIESLVYGVPVLSTPESADGLVGLSNEDNILIAQSDKEFSSAIKSVIDNPKILEDIRINGRRTYEKYYSQKVNSRALKELLNKHIHYT